ncbi:unnamed protein product, partial [Sphenostylis stenocarpa]
MEEVNWYLTARIVGILILFGFHAMQRVLLFNYFDQKQGISTCSSFEEDKVILDNVEVWCRSR